MIAFAARPTLAAAIALAAICAPAAAQQPYTPIGELRADRDGDRSPDLLGQQVTVTGRATVSSGVLSSRGTYFYVEDRTGGIALYDRRRGAPVRDGDSLVATGRVSLFRGSVRLTAVEYRVERGRRARVRATAASATREGLAPNLGRLIRVRARLRGSGSNAAGDYLTLRASRNGPDIHVFVARLSATGIDLHRFEAGDELDVVGVLDVFQSAEPVPLQFEIYPRSPADLRVVGISHAWQRRSVLLLVVGLALAVGWTLVLRGRVKRKTAEVLATTQWYRALLENQSDAVVVVDGAGTVMYTSGSSEHIHGYKPEERIGHPFSEIIHPDDLPEVVRQFRLVRDNPRATVALEARLHHKTGGWRRVRYVARNMLDHPTVGGIVVNYSDVTEQAAAEAERDRLFMLSADLLCAVGLDGRFRRVNPAFQTTLGYEERELTGEPILSIIHPDDLPAWRDAARRLRAGATIRVEGRVRARDGAYRRVSAVAVPDPATERAYVIARDVTAERDREARLREAHKMEAVGRLAGGIAHDFNNLLTAILSYADFLRADIPSDDRRRGDLEEIHAAATRAAALTRQLLTFSRGRVLEPSLSDVNTVVADLQNMLDRLLGEDIETVRLLDTALPPVKVDHAQLEQVVLNLVLNARDAMPDGGLLSIETSTRAVGENVLADHSGAAIPPGKYVVLSVTDSGVGMDETTERKIFEPFFTTKAPGSGTGLGLATVYGIVRQSRGFIRVRTEPHRGTTFDVFLPMAEGPRPAVPDVEGAGGAPMEHEVAATILVAEDEESVRAAVKRILREAGYDVVDAASGREAARLFDADPERFDLLVTDAIMPEMSGSALAAYCVSRRPDLPVLVMSGYTDEPVDPLMTGTRMSAFVGKPFSKAGILKAVRGLLARAGASSAASA